MPELNKKSLEKLETCDERIQAAVKEVVKIYDITVLEGHRPQDLQDLYFEQGKSKVKWPDGKHNKTPSQAVDLAPYPINWTEKKKVRFYFMAGIVKTVSGVLGVKFKWGGDWDSDMDFFDQNFMDLPHFEILLSGPT